jgi:hypothetical protein
MDPKVVKSITDSFNKLIEQVPSLLDLFGKFLKVVADRVPKVLEFTKNIGGLSTALTIMAGIMVLDAIAGFITMATVISGVLIPVFGALIGAVAAFDVAMLLNPLGLFIAACIGLTAIVVLIAAKWEPLKAFFTKLFTDSLASIHLIWSGLTGWFENLLWGVEHAFSDTWKRIDAGIPSWLKQLMKIGGAGLLFSFDPAAGVAAAAAAMAPKPIPRGPPAAMRAPAAYGGRNAPVVGKILVSAAPGSVVRKLSAAGGFDLEHSRGLLLA